jgi:hypothetical protein
MKRQLPVGNRRVAEGVAFHFRAALLAKPVCCRRQPLISDSFAFIVRERLHFQPVADFLTGHNVDRRSNGIKDDDRTLGLL